MKIRFSPRAVDDLGAIADYLSDRSASGALAVERQIHATLKLLSEFPRCGRILDYRPNVRVIPVTRHPYLLFYSVSGDQIVVLHVRHGARRPIEPDEL